MAIIYPPTVGFSNWSVPKRYHARLIASRARRFSEKVIALTFDDGPDPVVTPRVLSTLAKFRAKATFFVLGRNVHRYPALLKRTALAGHAIGNHSYTHPAHPAEASAIWELAQTEKAAKGVLGKHLPIFRPPYGITSNRLTKNALKFGYSVITWTLSSADTGTRDSNVIAYNILAHPKPGDIVLFHDGYGHAPTALALPRILKVLRKRGFTFVTVPELLRRWNSFYDHMPSIQLASLHGHRRPQKTVQ